MDGDSQRDRGWWLPKEVVCPYCHKSVVAKGMRKHLALTCTMVPLEIRKEMKGRMGLNQEKGKLPLPSHQIIGFSLLGVILVSPIVERSLLYFLLGTWVLQTIVIITFYPTKRV